VERESDELSAGAAPGANDAAAGTTSEGTL
jgi:hypothetical protein